MILQLFSFITRSNRNAILFFVIISSFFFVGNNHLHLFDWDEINFAESSREMIASSNYLKVQINFTSFWEKPPLFFWMQVLSMKVFGINEFAARFPNALFGFFYLITFYFIGKSHFNAKFGIIWALLFFGSLLPHLYFKSGIIDPVFNFFIFLSIYFMIISFKGEYKQFALFAFLSGIFSGLSVLTKGPVGFLILALTFMAYIVIKRFKVLPNYKSILLFSLGLIATLSVWIGIEYYSNGWEILIQFIEYQLDLFNSGVAGHEQPFYYHFVVVFFGCFPISIFALPLFFKKSNAISYDLKAWMLCLFWVVMILFSITTTKIIHYSSLTYIPLSFVAALFFHRAEMKELKFSKIILRLYLIVGLIVGIIITVLPVILINKEFIIHYIKDPFAVDSLQTTLDWSGYEFIIGLFFIICVVLSYLHLIKSNFNKALITISGSMGITLLSILFFILPNIEEFTQGPVIRFYQKLEKKDCYVDSFGYKSYAQYYYFKQPNGLSEKRKDKEWLLNGDIDKPVFLVSKSTNTELDNHPNFKFIRREGGFNFYKREIPRLR